MRSAGEEAEQLALYASEGPPEHGLPAVRRLRELLDRWEAAQLAAARGYRWNWGEIGRVLGRSRQAVHARYRAKTSSTAEPAGSRPLTTAEFWAEDRRLLEQKARGELTSDQWWVARTRLWDQLP